MKTQRLLLLFMAALIAFAAAPPVPAARAAHGVPLALFDPNSTGWYSIRNMTVAAHQDFFNTKAAAGYMMIDAERLEISGQLRVSSVWQRNADGRAWASRSNLTSDEFHAYWVQYRNEGLRLIDQDAYPINGQLHYAGIWVQNVENLDWASYRNLTSDEFATYFDDFSKRGFILVDTEAYNTGDGLRYSQIWVKNTDGLGWIALRNMSSDEYAGYFSQYADEGYRVLDLESYQVGLSQRYAAIWIKNTNGRGWYAYRDMSAQDYGNRWLQLRDAGYRVIDFEVYDTALGTRYAGVWRQNNDRPNWRLKEPVTKIIEDYLADNNIAGLGVAIATDNKFRYLRGFGYADIALNRVFHSGTIARAASGC
ncbi:MAG: hypothetical protein H7Y32_18385 [Chloroflexales bacterium]|nr:hypothetical protein [Chloroflexales bacterium]